MRAHHRGDQIGRPDTHNAPWARLPMARRRWSALHALALTALAAPALAQGEPVQTIALDGKAGGKRFHGIGVVDGGGATSVLLKDYPDKARGEILDLLYKPKFGASVSALYVEIPGDGNSTQGSMPSHMHSRNETNYRRGYSWWVMQEARRRNPRLTLDAAAWSAPGWIGSQGPLFAQNSEPNSDGAFFSQDTADYYVSWLKGLRQVYGLELDALGTRNEKGVNYDFLIALRRTLNANGFQTVRLHGFDNWPDAWKFAFVKDMPGNVELRNAVDIISAHMNAPEYRAPAEVQEAAAAMGKPIWNTEQHVYKAGYDGLISIVQAFNDNFIHSGATKIVNWYGIAGLYEMESYSGDKEAAVRANWPWSGHYRINPSLWGYAHYGQFSEVGWQYLNGGSGELRAGGTYVALASPTHDYSVVFETKNAKEAQTVTLNVGGGLSSASLAVWRSDAREQFVRLDDVAAQSGSLTLRLEPQAVYSVTTTRGQRKGGFADVPAISRFPTPYADDFDGYGDPSRRGYLPRYFADIAGAFELAPCPARRGVCLRQAVSRPPISWAPNWQPYTIIGDDNWTDYEIASDVHLASGESGAVMGRVNSVGTGYGYIFQGYMLTLSADGVAQLVLSRGKLDKAELVGDAEQQALIRTAHDKKPGGTTVLAEADLGTRGANRWHRLSLRFSGSAITGLVDGKPVLAARDATYAHGMAGLLAGAGTRFWSTPYYDNLTIRSAHDAAKPRLTPLPSPLYPPLPANKGLR